MSTERMEFADGKYTVIKDNGFLKALRHGKPLGRGPVGDNLFYAMFCKARDLEAQRDELLASMSEMRPFIEDLHDVGPSGEGWKSDKLDQAIKRFEQAIAKVKGGA